MADILGCFILTCGAFLCLVAAPLASTHQVQWQPPSVITKIISDHWHVCVWGEGGAMMHNIALI